MMKLTKNNIKQWKVELDKTCTSMGITNYYRSHPDKEFLFYKGCTPEEYIRLNPCLPIYGLE